MNPQKPTTEVPASHTPGRDHDRKSKPPKTRRFQAKAAKKRKEEWKEYYDTKRKWNDMLEPERRWRSACDPERLRPKGEPPIMNVKLSTLIKLEYLCNKMRYWLYARNDHAYARRHYLDRLEGVLRDLPKNEGSIDRQEGLAILNELKGNKALAIKHREQEISMMESLHKSAEKHTRSSTRLFVLKDRDKDALKERQAILQGLKQASGRIRR